MRAQSKRRAEQSFASASWSALGDNVGFPFVPDAVKTFQQGLAGTVVLASGAGYLEARQAFVPNYQEFPLLVVYCENISDVARSLDFAREFNLWVTCRSGGHSPAGYSVNTGMVIDLSRMNDVFVDPVAKRAVVGAGTTFGKLNAALDSYKLHAVGGGCADVGIGGYMQGGGYGATSMIYGLNCDCVESVLVALYDGTLVEADATTNADLFWAVRGGTGGNFGVLLQVRYRLFDLWQVWGFGIQWPLENAPLALDVFQREFTGSAVPPKLGVEAILGPAVQPPPPQGFSVLGLYDGSEDEGMAAIAPLLQVPGAVQTAGMMGTYADINETLFGSDPSPQPRTLADSRYVSATLGPDGWKRLVDLAASSPNGANFIAFEPYGGKILETSATECAFIHRQPGFDVFIWVFWMNDEEEADSMAFLAEFVALMDELGNGEAFQNYPRRENEQFREMYWSSSYTTLQAVKAKYDPTNFFHFQQSITGNVPPPGTHLLVDVSGPIVPSTTVFRPEPVIVYTPTGSS